MGKAIWDRIVAGFNALGHAQTLWTVAGMFGVTGASIYSAYWSTVSGWHPIIACLIGLAALALGMFVLVCVATFREPKGFKENEAVEPIEQPSTEQAKAPIGDWPIDDAAQHIANSISERDIDEVGLAKAVIKEIITRAVNGEITLLGELHNPQKQSSNMILSNSKIPSRYWVTNSLKYITHEDENGKYRLNIRPNSNTDGNSDLYKNIHASKAQILEIWPELRDATLQELIFKLAKMRSSGVFIRNSGQSMDGNHFQKWVHSVETWRNEVCKAIEAISRTDAKLFDTLDTVPLPRVEAIMRSETDSSVQAHAMFFRQHDFRLVKLELLIDKYQRMGN